MKLGTNRPEQIRQDRIPPAPPHIMPRNEAAGLPMIGSESDAWTFVKVGESPILALGGNPIGYGSLMSVDFAACEQTKCRSLASFPFSVVKKGAARERVPDHPLARLLNGMANEAMSSIDLLNWHRLRCDTFGNAYWRVEWNKSDIVALWPVTCAVTQRFVKGNKPGYRVIYHLVGDDYNAAGDYFSNEIVNIKTNITKDGVTGVSLARVAAEQLGLSIDLEKFYRAMLKNGNHQFGHVEIPEKNIPDPAKNDLREAINSMAGIDNAGRAPILAYGAKWVNDNQTMRDASIIDQQRWVLEQVCRACNVPPWKVYDHTGINYAASQQANIDYVTDTCLPDVRAIEQAFIPIFKSRNEDDLELKGNMRGLMRADDASRSQYYREMVYSGIYTRAQVLELEDMPPVEGLDKPLFPLNYGTVEPDGSVLVYSSGDAEPADGNQTGTTD